MPLLASDIRFAASSNMADVPEGGGPPSSKLLTSGRSNEIFPDISEETRTVGRVEIYQIFGVLRNSDRAALLGANCIVASPPTDPNVSVTLLSLRDPFATRRDIAKRIESGMSAGSEWNGFLLENHFTTMRVLQFLQRPGTPPPAVGKTLVLIYQEGTDSERRQRVRIKSVATEVRVFNDTSGGGVGSTYEGQVSTCEIFDGLLYDFPGSPPIRSFTRSSTKTLTRETTYSDGGVFYSASKLTQATTLLDTWIQVQSVYTQVVPNSRAEAASFDQRPAARRTIVLADYSPRRIEVGVTPHTQRVKVQENNLGLNYVFQCRPAPAPGTIVIDFWALGQRYTLTDDGTGRLTGQGGGSVAYDTGAVLCTLKVLPDIGSLITLSHGSRAAYTNQTALGLPPRAPEYSFIVGEQSGSAITDSERITPTTLVVTYPSGGQIRTVTDSGSGALQGAGTGTVDYLRRVVTLRPQFMPDPGATFQIDCEIDALAATQIITSPTPPDAAGITTFTLASPPTPGSVEVTWKVARKTSSSSGVKLDTSYTRDSLRTTPTRSYSHTKGGYLTLTVRRGATGAATTEESVQESDRIVTTRTVTDDGQGGLGDNSQTPLPPGVSVPQGQPEEEGFGPGGAYEGTVDYVTGQVALKVVAFHAYAESYKSDYEKATTFASIVEETSAATEDNARKGGEAGSSSVGEELLAASSIVVRYHSGPLSATRTHSETFTPPAVSLPLRPYTSQRVIPGSVQFRWLGHTYLDYDGTVYRSPLDLVSGYGIPSGTLDYVTGIAQMYDYVVGNTDPLSFELQSLWTQAGQWTTASVFFNTESAPLRAGPGGLVLTVLDAHGTTLTANVNDQGIVSGSHMWGIVDFARGGVQLQFGDFVLDDGLSAAEKAEWWYDAADVGAVQAGKVWRPWPVDPSTLRYSCINYVYLPVDSTLMGLDPAALPPDGRVPFARPGDTCVIGLTHSAPSFVASAGLTHSVGHERLSFAQVQDAATGQPIDSGYTVNLDAGTVTFTDVTGYPASVCVVARTEVYRQIAEVRVDGKVRLTTPVGYAFTTDAVFSTALRQGDRFARVSRVYDQASWSGTTWYDGLDPAKGSATATYDHAGVPIEVTNRGAITERWAARIRSDGTTFDLIGQHLGQIATGSINADFAPLNAAAQVPYFTLRATGWGAGWVAGNVLFFDTVGAEAQIALVRCTQPSSPAGLDDSFWLVQRGDTARPPEAD